MRTTLWIVLTFAVTAASTLNARADDTVEIRNTLPSGDRNAHYVGNQPPLRATPLTRLPIGSIRPEGWVRTQLQLLADGMVGHLTEISPWCKFEGNAWVSRDGHGENGWEELPYWLKGFIDLGYVLNDQRIIDESRKWIEGVIASQRPDGFFGGEANREKSDLWPHMVMLFALRTYHDATGDKRVLDLMTRYFKWQTGLPLEKYFPASWQKWRAGDNLDSIYWLYNRTREPWLLDLARINHECSAGWTQGIPTWHGVNLCQCFRGPAQYYQQSNDIRHLNAMLRNYDTVMGIYGQVPGGMFGADENARPSYIGPRQGAETCSMVELMFSHEMLLGITGNAIWADRCEEIAFNSLPSAMTADLKALHYLTAPNQVQLDRRGKAPMIENGGDMFSYTPYEQYRCCQHNVAFGWPYFAEHLWMATADNGLAATLYAECSVKAKVGDGTEVRIDEKTDYPFGDKIVFKVSLSKPVTFPLSLRLPRWYDRALLSINGKEAEKPAKPLDWIVIKREWRDGDTVTLQLPMSIAARMWDKNGNTVSISRGPLFYSLKIGEEWKRYDNGKQWPAFEVFPSTPWNYGLVVDVKNPESSFEVVSAGAKEKKDGPLSAQPFTVENAPLSLRAKGKRIPQWILETNGLVGEIWQSPVRSSEPVETIELIPMGCARLRVSAFPIIAEGDAAPTWTNPNKTQLFATASFIRPQDPITSLYDGRMPDSSSDTKIPRFTWYDRFGTGEWVQYQFPEPKRISACEVYWLDDARMGGGCGVPLSWKLIYRDGTTWKPVEPTSDYGIALDKINRVTFKPITTTFLRLIAELSPETSGGILEWRVEE